MQRYFTRAHASPYNSVQWEKRLALIMGEDGRPVFEQRDVEFPHTWSQLATNVVASKYFRGPLGAPHREHSVQQLLGRVVQTITAWGRKDGYFATEQDAVIFADELTYLLLHQRASFNSPVWFNVGVEAQPQASACFILSVEDSMESILEWYREEGMIFKGGSGSGVNLSTIRGSREQLSSGGIASGPLSFMRAADASAGAIKSGGKTRRAAKMIILNADHPDIEAFIRCKAEEEQKACALIDSGYDASLDGTAYASVFFQNANHSVRVPDAFMHAVLNNGVWQTRYITTGAVCQNYPARDLLRMIAEATHACGDPGMQFDTAINDWHTCANTDRIYSSNPCSEYMFLNDTACNLSSINLLRFLDADGEFEVDAYRHAVDLLITAQEILVGNATYPTPDIAQNSHDFRPLGLGYANLGALLMARGLAYDSDAGRAYAAAITALMTGQAYLTSAKIAEVTGPFAGYAVNREPMLRVMGKHRDSVQKIDQAAVPAPLLQAAIHAWDEAVAEGTQYGYRNAQASVLAPTGCLVGDSLILTSRGLVRLQTLGNPAGDQWQPLDVHVATDEGARQATQFYVNGVAPVVTIETKRGYRIQGTPVHRIKVLCADGTWQWKHFADIQGGETVPLKLGGMVGEPSAVALPPLGDAYWTSDHTTFVPRTMTADLAEFLGYFMGDGSLHAKGLRLCVAQADRDVVERLCKLGQTLFGLRATVTDKTGYVEVGFNSVRLVMWWEACDFAKRPPQLGHTGKGYVAHIPDAVVYTNDPEIYAAFLRGLFEADGNIASGYLYWSTVTKKFSQDVQTLLLALGFVTTRKIDQPAFGKFGTNPQFVLRLLNAATTAQFVHDIGLLSQRKRALALAADHPQAARYDHIPVSRALIDVLAPENDALRKTLLMSLARHGTVSRRAAMTLFERSADPTLGHLLGFFYDEVTSTVVEEEQPTYDLSVPANVTYIANGFISHNTISFMMDCDTTGVEPDIALIKYKKLGGGGTVKIVNATVPLALKRLGYPPYQIQEIVQYIDEHETIEGAPHLHNAHLPVFDCAFRPTGGTRSIHYTGHIRMMAAVQPFLSGSISKTVNLPHEATVEDIEQAYILGWQLGVKALAVYRDGCKRTQPLNTRADAEATTQAAKPVRRRLPDERPAITHKFSIAGHEGYITVGMFEDGTPGEIFLVMAKEGSTISGLVDAFATSISLALQYGVPLRDLIDKFSHMRFEPAGFTQNKEIPIAKSLMDYIFRWLASKFLDHEDRAQIGVIDPLEDLGATQPLLPGLVTSEAPRNGHARAGTTATARLPFRLQEDAPSCAECGALMIRNGACYKCLNCGATSGCS